jgi:3-hydroxybutyryl-CoA dehydrogenase
MEIKNVGVIGSGLMGSGIAQVAASTGYHVTLLDISEEQLTKAQAKISKSLDKFVQKEKITASQRDETLKRLKTTTQMKDLSNCDFVIEAASEKVQVKLDLFKKLDEICADHTILVTNTSSISITKVAASTKRPEKVAGMHFMNPVPIMKLVEGIKGLRTSDETFTQVKALCSKMGKTFVESKDSPAFVVNRILVPMLNEAIFALQEGLATKEDIDTAMKLGCNFPMGPFELLDFVGLDTAQSILEVMYRDTGDSKYRPCPLLKKYVEAGYHGRKSGRGFYEYT